MKIEEAQKLYSEMKSCSACAMRQGCTQVVTYDGFLDDTPLLLVVGEAPRKEDDEQGKPFSDDCGILLREALRATKVLKKNNTVITNTIKCQPPGEKFPTDKNIPRLCVSKWLDKEIATIEPKRMLILGSMPLLFVAGLKGISKTRGNWLNVKGVRTMATFHPSYVIRQMNDGDLETRQNFFDDIKMVAEEVARLQEVLT